MFVDAVLHNSNGHPLAVNSREQSPNFYLLNLGAARQEGNIA